MNLCPTCFEKINLEDKICKNCGTDIIDYNKEVEISTTGKKTKIIAGFRGFLFILGLVIISIYFHIVLRIKDYYITIINNPEFLQIVTPNSSEYIKYFIHIFSFGLIMNIVGLLLILISVFYYINKSNSFKKFFMFSLLYYFLLNLINVGVQYIYAGNLINIQFFGISLLISFLVLIIWGNYILKSQRVDRTFVMFDYSPNILSSLFVIILLLYGLSSFANLNVENLHPLTNSLIWLGTFN